MVVVFAANYPLVFMGMPRWRKISTKCFEGMIYALEHTEHLRFPECSGIVPSHVAKIDEYDHGLRA